MHTSDALFTSFKSSVDAITPPSKFTFPFFYTPHPLAVLAAEQLQQHLETQTTWQHDFGDSTITKSSGTGKMFGVLVVKDHQDQLGFLSAFSGKIADSNLLPHFVPPVFDMLAEDSFYQKEYEEINHVTRAMKQLEESDNLESLKLEIDRINETTSHDIALHRECMIENRKQRKQARVTAESEVKSQQITEAEFNTLSIQLSRASVSDKNTLSRLKTTQANALHEKKVALEDKINKRKELKKERARISNQLQHKLFAQYAFLNAHGVHKDLNEIFADTPNKVPPAGAGECAAPKMLQYAYLNGFQPICFTEFWWGCSPKSEIRKHKQFYPSCTGKCQPILTHMLDGLDVDPNPLLENPAAGKELDILYSDEHIVVVNKPANFLSVPGKTIKDSVLERLVQLYPNVEGPFVVHRLDMATSGLLVFALTKRANKHIQQQFVTREVQKRYVALIEGTQTEKNGTISLPLRGDQFDRPRQIVCFEHGKPAETYWETIEAKDNKTKLYLYPKTGRTHQLRMHCAHHLGLNSPIVGDTLYGKMNDRLYLHAEKLEFTHPITKQPLSFQIDADF